MSRRHLLIVLAACLAVVLVASSNLPGRQDGPARQQLPVEDVQALRDQVGQDVTVVGQIERTGESRTGHQFLNFANSELTAVCFPQHLVNFPEGKPSELYRNKEVELTGKLERYQGKLQIRLRDPSQIHVVVHQHPEASTKFALKEIGRDTWLSPGGLRYRGRDSEGLTRVEHIRRHTRDIPERDGPHGVFDGGPDLAFAVIDEAWRLAQERKLRPQKEGDRSSYTVDLRRRIGFLGGRAGAAQDHPPLRRVFLVFTTGTQDIITAFPK